MAALLLVAEHDGPTMFARISPRRDSRYPAPSRPHKSRHSRKRIAPFFRAALEVAEAISIDLHPERT
jgi:hypothetical protein